MSEVLSKVSVRRRVAGLTIVGLTVAGLAADRNMEAPSAAITQERVDRFSVLPPVEGGLWADDNISNSLGSYDSTTHQLTIDKDTPREYREAIKATIQNPIVNYSIKRGYVDSVAFNTASKDGGLFEPNDSFDQGKDEQPGDLILDISSGRNGSRTYTHREAMVSIGVHEAAHAIAESWYRQLQEEPDIEAITPAELREPLKHMLHLCRNIQADQLANYIDGHRETVVQTYHQSSENFVQYGQELLADDDPSNDTQKLRMDTIASVLARTATQIEVGDDYITALDQGKDCYVQNLLEPPFAEATASGDLDQMDEYYQEDPAAPIVDLQMSFRHNIEEGYACIKDAEALADLLNTKPGSAGHGYDNLTEFFASVIATLDANPGYLRNCIDTLPETEAHKFTELIKATIEVASITDPQLIEILRETGHEQSEVLNWIAQS